MYLQLDVDRSKDCHHCRHFFHQKLQPKGCNNCKLLGVLKPQCCELPQNHTKISQNHITAIANHYAPLIKIYLREVNTLNEQTMRVTINKYTEIQHAKILLTFKILSS